MEARTTASGITDEAPDRAPGDDPVRTDGGGIGPVAEGAEYDELTPGREPLEEAVEPEPERESDPDAAIRKVAEGGDISAEEEMDATDWLLSDDPEVGRTAARTLRVNVRDDDHPLWIDWRVRAITDGELRAIQKETNTTRARKQAISGTGADDMELHCRIIAQVTVKPDLKEAAKAANDGRPVTNLGRFVRGRFAHKPGLIPQLSQQIMQLSGFDDADVQEVEAAGN